VLIDGSYAVVHFWYLLPGNPADDLADVEIDTQVSGRPDGMGHVHSENADFGP